MNTEDSKIVINEKAQKVIEINNILFKSKRYIDWNKVEEYLKQYIGKSYRIDELDEMVYIGKDFPDEYTHSKYSRGIHGTIGKAKANLTQAIPQLIQNADNFSYNSNKEQKHQIDAYNGWYRCTIHFTLPICNDKEEIVGKNKFRGRMLLRCDKDKKLYLYDIINIKKES